MEQTQGTFPYKGDPRTQRLISLFSEKWFTQKEILNTMIKDGMIRDNLLGKLKGIIILKNDQPLGNQSYFFFEDKKSGTYTFLRERITPY